MKPHPSILTSVSIFILITITLSSATPQIDKTYWNSNWQAMYFEQSGNQVSSEYIWDKGVITATFTGDTLIGWWREYNNAQTCGPQGQWSGRILFLFAPDGKSFTGSWVYCTDSTSVLDPHGTGWTGTIRDSAYNQQECTSAGRNWCNNACQITACDSVITKTQCEAAGRFWCDNQCSLSQCSAAIRPFVAGSARRQSLAADNDNLYNAQGRCVDASATKNIDADNFLIRK